MFLWGALLIGTAVYFGALDACRRKPVAGGAWAKHSDWSWGFMAY